MRKWLRRHPLFTSNAAITAAGVIAVLTIGSLWFVRGHQLAQHQARELLRGLQTRLGDARTTLNTPWIDEATLVSAVDAAETTLQNCRLLESNDLTRSGTLALLSPREQRQLCRDAGELLYLLAGAKGQQAMHSDRRPDRQRLLDEALQLNQRAQIVTADLQTERAFLLQRTRLLAAAGYTKGAEKLRQRALAEGSDLSDKRLLAVERAAEQEYTAAVGLLEEAIRHSPQDYTLWFSLGNCHMSLQEFADAEGCFTTAIALRPNFILGYHHRGLTRLGLHDYSGARVDFDTVIGRRPDFTAALVNRALVYRGLGQPDLAIRDLTLALDRGATQTRIYFLRARLRSEVGDSEGAERDQRDGLRLQPRDELSWIARGVAKLPSAPEAALADFSEARRLNPRSRGALQNTAYTLSEILGETEQGVTVMNELVALDPTDPTALASRGVLLARLGKRAQAIADAEAALLATDNPDILYQVGGIYALTSAHQRADADRAVALIARSLKLKPSLVTLTTHDPDLYPLRGYPKYREVVMTAEALLNFREEGSRH
jgi:tetratricopeptide (TPR) repeat protein